MPAECGERSIPNIMRKKMRLFGNPNLPKIPPGSPPNITTLVLNTLRDYLAKTPGLYIEETAQCL